MAYIPELSFKPRFSLLQTKKEKDEEKPKVRESDDESGKPEDREKSVPSGVEVDCSDDTEVTGTMPFFCIVVAKPQKELFCKIDSW